MPKLDEWGFVEGASKLPVVEEQINTGTFFDTDKYYEELNSKQEAIANRAKEILSQNKYYQKATIDNNWLLINELRHLAQMQADNELHDANWDLGK